MDGDENYAEEMRNLGFTDAEIASLGDACTCEDCGSDDGRICLEPFALAIGGNLALACLCPSCYENACRGI